MAPINGTNSSSNGISSLLSTPTNKRKLPLEGKVAIVTGGASGFGESTVRLFVQNGAKVIVADVQDKLGNALSEELNQSADADSDTDTATATATADADSDTDTATATADVIYVHCDVTSDTDVKNLVDMAISKFGKLDIMFNNAGITGDLDFNIVNVGNENFKRVFDVNVFGAFLGAKYAAKVMIPAKKGVILFTASLAAVSSGESPYSYAVSKHAIAGLTKDLCVELGQHGIRVNCISPCAVATPMLSNAMGVDKSIVEGIICASANLKGAVPRSEDVAEAALYLCSDGAKFVSGLNLVIDGGYSLTNQSYTNEIKKVLASISK